jgi:methylmalonyl-CoA mutase cobalamin-binding subunit
MPDLIPEKLPDGRAIAREGMALGRAIEIPRSPFLAHRGVRTEDEWRRLQARRGNIQWDVLLGLATHAEQVAALDYLWSWGQSHGVEIDRCAHIGNMLNGLPPAARAGVPRPTSFLMESGADYKALADAAPMQSTTFDHALGSPNSVANTTHWLQAGCTNVGNVSQHVWKYPGWNDEIAQEIETVKAIGIMASKRSQGAIVGSYLGDGITSQLLDHASEIGYMMLERYVVDELCGAAYGAGTGGIHSDIPGKLATWLALDQVLRSPDHLATLFLEGNTIETSEHFASNYGLVVAEFIPFALLERKYSTGTAYKPKPVTESVRVPTLDEIIDALSACVVALRKAREYETAGLMDFTAIEGKRDVLVQQGKRFFSNALAGLTARGVDIADPLAVLLALRRLGGAQLEQMAHPGARDAGMPRGIVPYVATDLARQPARALAQALEQIRAAGVGSAAQGKLVVVGSTDVHEFGVGVVRGVLEANGARVIDGGVELDPRQMFELARAQGARHVCVSTHNGACLAWGRQLLELAAARNVELVVMMGGILNSMAPGSTEPTDVTAELQALGIHACQRPLDIFAVLGADHPGN